MIIKIHLAQYPIGSTQITIEELDCVIQYSYDCNINFDNEEEFRKHMSKIKSDVLIIAIDTGQHGFYKRCGFRTYSKEELKQ